VAPVSDYESAFGLIDNPFCPNTFGAVGERALDDISCDPLLLDSEPGLMELFVPEAGPFGERIERFEAMLKTRGYMPAAPPRRKKSMAFRVIGPEGSGKSTLANLLVGRLRDCLGEDLLLVKESARDSLDTAIQRVRSQAGNHGFSCCCIVVDDARLDHQERLRGLYDELRRAAPVVSFEVIHDAHDLERQRRVTASGLAEDLETSWLRPDHAEGFVTSRIELFRAPNTTASLTGDLALFPFDADEIRSAVATETVDGKSLTLRTLNWILGRGLERELSRLEGEEAIGSLAPEKLRERIVEVRRLYVEAVIGVPGGTR